MLFLNDLELVHFPTSIAICSPHLKGFSFCDLILIIINDLLAHTKVVSIIVNLY